MRGQRITFSDSMSIIFIFNLHNCGLVGASSFLNELRLTSTRLEIRLVNVPHAPNSNRNVV